MKTLKNRKNTEGSTFILATIFCSLLFITSASFLLMISSEYKLNNRSYRSAVAINLAEAGIDYAIRALETGDISSWSGTNPKTKTVYSFQTAGGTNMGDFHVEVADPDADSPLVESTGYVPGMAASEKITRTVKVKLGPRKIHPFADAFLASEFIKVAGSATTDSYDSRLGEYGGENVGSNGDVRTSATGQGVIEVDGTAIVNGDGATGPGGTIIGEESITGTITHDCTVELPEVEVPSGLTGLYYWDGFGLLTLTGSNTYTLDPGDYKFKRIKITASAKLIINGPARLYITGYSGTSIFLTGGNSEIICNGNVVFYVDDDVKCGGNGLTNSAQTPPDCILWGTSTCENIDIGGSSSFHAGIYAPSTEIDFTSSAQGFGSFVGKKVIFTGGSGYHYDEALEETEISLSGYSIAYWQEKE